jgi:predicted RNA binding protein YcfA (HicA-like mRNA interferase family)
VVVALGKIGYQFDRQRGSHIVLRHTDPPHRRLTVPDHAEVAKGTLRAIIRQAGLCIHVLQQDGLYIVSPTSRCLPELPVQEMISYLRPNEELDDTTRVRQFVEHVSPHFRR